MEYCSVMKTNELQVHIIYVSYEILHNSYQTQKRYVLYDLPHQVKKWAHHSFDDRNQDSGHLEEIGTVIGRH